MGEGYVMKCTKCGKEHHMYLGIGFLFPQEFQQVQKEAKAGRYGKRLQQILKDCPGTVVDAERDLFYCPVCGQWEVGPVLDAYIPDIPAEGTDSNYYMADDLQNSGRVRKEYSRICSCGQKMQRWDGQKPLAELGLKCPDCGGDLEMLNDLIMWD